MTLQETLIKQLKRHEGFRGMAYLDTVGKWTIGYGRNLDDVGISLEEAEYLLSHDMQRAILNAKSSFPNFDSLSINRQSVIANMIFNLGINRFSMFQKTIHHIKDGDFAKAADEMIASKWAKQVGSRAVELAELMRKG